MPAEPQPPAHPPVPGVAGEHDHYFTADPASAAERRTLDVRLADREVTVHTAAGVFSAGGIDLGTEVLLRTVPAPPPTGTLLDLGCGWGPLALTMALRSPCADVWAVDVNRRAVDLLGRTAHGLDLDRLTATTPDGVPADLRFDVLWSNPPIRIGKAELHALLAHWLGRLAPGGTAWLVVQRHLGADSLQRWIAAELGLRVDRAASAKGFRVLEVGAAD